MKRNFLVMLALLTPLAVHAQTDGMVTKTSKHDYRGTQSRLEAALKDKDLKLFSKIDHTAGAIKAGLKMQPETLFIFGNPKGGTPFMVAAPTAAIDFPLKALVWEDKAGKVFVTYSTMDYIVQRHHITGMDDAVKKLNGVLDAVSSAATE